MIWSWWITCLSFHRRCQEDSFDDPDPVVGAEEKLRPAMRRRRDGPSGAPTCPGKIVIQVDKNMDFDCLFKIMNTCGKVGCNNMNFAVMERDE